MTADLRLDPLAVPAHLTIRNLFQARCRAGLGARLRRNKMRFSRAAASPGVEDGNTPSRSMQVTAR